MSYLSNFALTCSLVSNWPSLDCGTEALKECSCFVKLCIGISKTKKLKPESLMKVIKEFYAQREN